MARESKVQLRIDRILEGNTSRALGRRARVVLLMCAAPVLYLASAAQLAPAQVAPAPSPLPTPFVLKQAIPVILAQAAPRPQPGPTPKPSMIDAQQRWVTEEVVYIITDEEKAAFDRLTTDDERAHFIEQFWQRRDPTPGTPENEYRHEHYRRIAYSNERFGWKDTPGWQTDRGRIYIVFGPPDEIESHPSDAGVVPHENWRYKWIEDLGFNVVLSFTDAALTGDYRLTSTQGIKGVVASTPQPEVSVWVSSDHLATISLALGSEPGPFNILVRVLRNDPVGSSGGGISGQPIVEQYDDGSIRGPIHTRTLKSPLRPGRYEVRTTLVNLATGVTSQRQATFTVQ